MVPAAITEITCAGLDLAAVLVVVLAAAVAVVLVAVAVVLAAVAVVLVVEGRQADGNGQCENKNS